MTVKTLSGSYTGGYTLSAAYSGLRITSQITVGPYGYGYASLVMPTGGTLATAGTILSYAYRDDGETGGDGAWFGQSASVRNSGTVRGGFGHYGYYYSDLEQPPAYSGGPGGNGGVGFDFAGQGGLTNTGRIAGGEGGPGSSSYGYGGNGGAAVLMRAGGAVTNSGHIVGGRGGEGGSALYRVAADGGEGGAGISLTGAGSVSNSGTIIGGAGGEGGGYSRFYFGETGHTYYGQPAPGGEGGAGVYLGGGGQLTNFGTIIGGAGGAGGAGGTFTSGGGHFTISAAPDGISGVGVRLAGAGTVINYGTIATVGGLAAVAFASPSDRLIAEAGSVFIGPVLGGGGAFELSGGTGTITGLGSHGRISGGVSATLAYFGVYQIDTGTWNLNGAYLSAGQLLTNAGTLNVVGGVQGTFTNLATGVIDAVGTPTTKFSASIANAGLVETTVSGGLDLDGATVSGAGVISAAGGSIRLLGADIVGGTLTSSAGAAIHVASGVDTLDGRTSALMNDGQVVIDNGETLTIRGVIDNSGTIAFGSAGKTTKLTFGVHGLTLTGGGEVFMGKQAGSLIVGPSASATLDNVANTIAGAGDLGGGRMSLNNESKGLIEAQSASALIIDTGPDTILNAGRIEAAGAGGLTIESALDNTGVLDAARGILAVEAAVTGAGRAVISGGTLSFASSFSQNVAFTGTTGVLELADSQAYAATVSGFSKTGGTSLDLADIAFVDGATTASYSGTSAAGVLTVTDGSHTSRIALKGDYLASTFTVSSDGHGGASVVDPVRASAPSALVAAMAGFRPRSGALLTRHGEEISARLALAVPRSVQRT
jgi:hypothetical protein